MAEAQVKLGYILDPLFQVENTNGKPVVGGHIEVYEAGTNVKYITYQNFDFTQNPFKIPLGSDGRAVVLGDCDLSYDVYIYDSFNNLIVSRLNVAAGDAGGVAGGGLREVIHDETMTGKGTQLSPLGVSPLTNLAVDETMTAYEATVEGKDSLVLGVNGDWFYNQFGSAFSGKVDLSAFNSAYYGIKGSLSSKADWSALNNYFTKNETYNTFLPRSAIDLNNYYTKDEVFNKSEINTILGFKEDKLDFGYNDSSAISSINGSALAGGDGGNCPWISGTKVIADTQTLTSNMIIQVLSSFTMSGDHNHFIGMKGGTYRFPNEYEIGSALLHTNYFMHLSGMSGYLPISSFSSYTASIANNLENNWNYTNSAYSLSINNFYNKLDASAFSSYSAGQESIINDITNQITNISGDLSSYATKTYVDGKDPVLIGDSNVTATSSKVDNHTQWNLAVNGTPVVTDTTLVGDNVVTAHTTQTSGEWIVGLVQSAYEAIDSIGDISNDVDTLKNASGSYYPLTGNPSGFLTTHQSLEDYYKKTETSSKEEISAAIAAIPQGDPDVNNFVQTNSSTIVGVDNVVTANSGLWLTAHQTIPSAKWENASDCVQTNSASWGTSVPTGDFALKSDFGFERVLNAGNQYFLFTVSGKQILKALSSEKTRDDIDGWPIKTTYLKISAASALSSTLSGAIDYISSNAGKTYTGVNPIQVNNTSNEISITGESLSAGPGIDLFESGGYVVISSYGGVGFPITGSNGTTAYTANMDCSSVFLTTASSPAGGYVKQTVQGVQYEAYPATDVSASWYNIINGANNRSNCYCIRFTNDMTAASLEDYSAYDKVTVVHSNQYTPDCMLYWDGNTKVFPSGLYCELVKGTNDQNQTDWFFTTSGWINNLEWDWD